MQDHRIAPVPAALDAQGLSGLGMPLLLSDADRGAFAPGRDAEMQREAGFGPDAAGIAPRKVDPDRDGPVEGIGGLFGDRDRLAVQRGADARRSIDQGGEAPVAAGVPEVLDQLGPALVQVAGAAGIAAEQAIDHVRALVLGREVAHVPCAGDLVDLLEILARVACVRLLGREGVVGDTFELLGPAQVSRDTEHPFQGIHHLDGGAEFRAAGRLAEMGHLVSGPESGRKAEGAPDGLHTLDGCLEVFFGLRPLPPDHGLLETLAEVDAVQGVLPGENVLSGKDFGPGLGLPVDQVAQFQQERLSGAVIQPPDHLQVVSAPPLAPVGPVLQRVLRKLLQLVAEVVGHHAQDPLVGGSHVVLFQDFEGDHLGPPVFGFSALEALDVGPGDAVAEVAIFLCGSQHRLDPLQGLRDQGLVIQQISEGQQPVDPVGPPFPSVPFAADPGIVVAHDRGIERIQVASHPVPLALQLVEEPALGPDGAEREFGIGVLGKRGPVENDLLGAEWQEAA